jgi:hypothetical protein
MAEFTPEELATINEIMRQQSGAATTPEEMQMQMMQMQPVQPQNFGALPPKESGAATTPEEMQMRQQQQPSQNMQGEQGKAQYLQQQIEAIRSRMGGGAPQTGSQRVMDAMGTLPPQQGAMTPEEMQQLQMMRGQR